MPFQCEHSLSGHSLWELRRRFAAAENVSFKELSASAEWAHAPHEGGRELAEPRAIYVEYELALLEGKRQWRKQLSGRQKLRVGAGLSHGAQDFDEAPSGKNRDDREDRWASSHQWHPFETSPPDGQGSNLTSPFGDLVYGSILPFMETIWPHVDLSASWRLDLGRRYRSVYETICERLRAINHLDARLTWQPHQRIWISLVGRNLSPLVHPPKESFKNVFSLN